MTGKKMVGILGVAAVVLAASVLGGRRVLAQKSEDQAPDVQAEPRPPQPPSHELLVRQDWFGRGEGSWLGVMTKDVTPDNVRELKLPGEYGAVVAKVEPGSPAAKAGLQANDVILQFAGERVRSVIELERLVEETPTGRTVSLEVSRDGQTRTLSVQLVRRENAFDHWVAPMPPMPRVEIPRVNIPRFNFNFDLLGSTRLGISGEDLSPQLAAYFGVKQGKGVLVSEVMSGSPAEKAGLRAGDCIIKVGSTDIDSVGELRRALAEGTDRSPDQKRSVTLTVVRDRREQTLKAEIDGAWHPSDQEVADLDREPQEYRALMRELQSPKMHQQLESARKQLEAAKSELQKIRQQMTPEKEKALQDELRRALDELRWDGSGTTI